ncbi:MAG: anti-sigma factor [Chloroflexi bacterium]|nr:MAG: anti-sigma factor [Chloroflexota bacterium]
MAIEHDELANLVPALVLGSVTPEEREQLLAHLEGCESCRELAASLARGAAALALEPDPVEPPARLHGRVLAAVAAARQDAAPPPRRGSRSPLPRSPRRSSRFRGMPLGLASAAALAFVLGTGLGAGVAHVRLPFAPAPASEVSRSPLHGTGGMAGVSAEAVTLKADGVTLVDFKDLPALAPGQVYELWLITGSGQAVPATVFVPDAQGSRVVVLARDLAGTRQLAVTVERGPDGAAAPSQPPQLSGRVA